VVVCIDAGMQLIGTYMLLGEMLHLHLCLSETVEL